jgi:hypothetical protein
MKSILVSISILLCANASWGQVKQNEDRILLDTENHVVNVSVKGESVLFTMEAIADFTEDRDDTPPLGFGWDFAGIRIDINNNNLIDNEIDLGFGTRQKTTLFCSQYLIHQNASSGCSVQRSKGSVRVEFKGTRYQELPHPVYIYSIPRSELSRFGGKIGLVFQFYDPETGKASYPSNRADYFKETIPLNLTTL